MKGEFFSDPIQSESLKKRVTLEVEDDSDMEHIPCNKKTPHTSQEIT